MIKSALTSALLIIFGIMTNSQPIPPDSLYLGQTPPGNMRKTFNLTADPGNYAVKKIAISPDGNCMYFAHYPGILTRREKSMARWF